MRTLIRSLAKLALAGSIAMATVAAGHAEDKVVRIGFQKYGTLILLKTKGLLEEKLKPTGYTVEWTEFPAGPQLLEALNVGSIDFGTTGEAPPIFAQAAGAPSVYVGYEPPAPEAEAILVPKDSRAEKRRRPQGQEHRAEQGLERPLSSGQGAGKGGRRPIPTSNLVPAAGRCPRRVREGRGRRLGDLGSVPGGGRGSDRRAASSLNGNGLVDNHQFYLASRDFAECASRRGRHHHRLARRGRQLDQGQQRRRRRGSSRRRSASPRRSSRSPCSASNMASNRFRRMSPPEQQKIADAFPAARPDPAPDPDLRSRGEAAVVSTAGLVPENVNVLWFLPTHGDGRLSRHRQSAAAPPACPT